MKKHYAFILACMPWLGLNAQDIVLPEGMSELLGNNVTLTSTYYSYQNKNKIAKPVVVNSNKLLFFTASTEANGDELWVSDLAPGSARMVKDIYPGTEGSNPQWLTPVGDKVYFTAISPDSGEELWVTDGTEEGTHMVKDIYSGEESSSPIALTEFEGKLLFFAIDDESEFLPVIDATKKEKWLWITDGTENGTERIGDTPTRDNNYDGRCGFIVTIEGKALFAGYSQEFNETLWVTDGTRAGTKPLKNINNRPAVGSVFATESAAIDHLIPVNNKWVVFRAETVSEQVGVDCGSEIWVSDGTPENTKWIGFDFAKGEKNGLPIGTQFAVTWAFGDKLYFRADDGIHGVEPCVFDLSKDIEEGVNPKLMVDVNHWGGNASLASWPGIFYEYDGYLYFSANGGYFLDSAPDKEIASGYYSLWRCDLGTYENLQYSKQFMDFELFPGKQEDCSWFVTVDGKMFFVAKDNTDNLELWMMENSASIPTKIVDFPDNGQPFNLMNVGNNLVFCSNKTKKIYYYKISSGIASTTMGTSVNVFPNPAVDQLSIQTDEEVVSSVLVDLSGRTVLQGKSEKSLPVSGLARGTYILKVTLSDNNVVTRKIILK